MKQVLLENPRQLSRVIAGELEGAESDVWVRLRLLGTGSLAAEVDGEPLKGSVRLRPWLGRRVPNQKLVESKTYAVLEKFAKDLERCPACGRESEHEVCRSCGAKSPELRWTLRDRYVFGLKE
ncbi:MAG: hypothetical protein KatS3mg109_0111 [Pirellulaceae bacterium]|nr:MAG: hypothetical protein KatS3mg109_0111 [Pirellulaceae bacterium]